MLNFIQQLVRNVVGMYPWSLGLVPEIFAVGGPGMAHLFVIKYTKYFKQSWKMHENMNSNIKCVFYWI
jgi:hypothetical protein